MLTNRICLSLVALVAACQSDPQYLSADMPLKGGMINPMTMEPMVAKASVLIPYKLETSKDRATRDALAANLGVVVPYVRLDDVRVSVEWTLSNDSNMAGTAMVTLNGANDRFYYDPTTIAYDAKEQPKPPSLLGNTPIQVPANTTVRGLFRDDQVLELAIDLELITRANQNPFRAVLQNNENDTSIQPMTIPDPKDPNAVAMPVGAPIPREALGHIVRVDIGLSSSQAMTLTYVVRVQDDRNIMHQKLLGAPMEELTTFTPMLYAPMIGM
jgi:hypothetical protein